MKTCADSKISWERDARNKNRDVPKNLRQKLKWKRCLFMNIGYEMEMQLRKILIFPTVDDQPVSRKMEFIHQALNGGI